MTYKTLLATCLAATLLGGCATSGTNATSSSDLYRSMANSQKPWCSTFDSSCTCTIDGQKTTCSLVYACLNSGNCTAR